MINKIALSGKLHSGKDTVASLLKGYFPNQFAISFATPMKQTVKAMVPEVPMEYLWGPSQLRDLIIPGLNLTSRKILTDLGKIGRLWDPDFWINRTMTMCQSALNDHDYIVITDLRFKNEMAALKKNDYFLVRIKRALGENESTDISEVDLDDVPESEFNFILDNTKDLENLRKEVERLSIILNQ